jgi:hypothetical protein
MFVVQPKLPLSRRTAAEFELLFYVIREFDDMYMCTYIPS